MFYEFYVDVYVNKKDIPNQNRGRSSETFKKAQMTDKPNTGIASIRTMRGF